MKKMILNEIIATKSSEVGISWFDFFSIGHICFGIGVFLFFSLFYTIPKAKGRTPLFSLFFVFILSFIIFIAWEIVENTLVLSWGLKYQDRADSIVNGIFDVILVGIGGLICSAFAFLLYEKVKKCEFPWFYLFNSLSFILFFMIYLALKF